MIDGKFIGFLLPKYKLKNQNKIDLLAKEIKNSKYNYEFLKIFNLNINKDNFILEKKIIMIIIYLI